MKIERIELSLLYLPYVRFFETSLGREEGREFIIVKAYSEGLCGYGEVVAAATPSYSYETTSTAWHILRDFLIPLVFAKGIVRPEDYYQEVKRYRGHPMAKAGLELALWDLQAKKAGVPLSKLYGGTRQDIEVGVSMGIEKTIPELLERIMSFSRPTSWPSTPAARRWLVRKGVQVVGVDYLSAAPYGQSKDTHRTLLEAGVVVIEGLDLTHVSQGLLLPVLPAAQAGRQRWSTGADDPGGRLTGRPYRYDHPGGLHVDRRCGDAGGAAHRRRFPDAARPRPAWGDRDTRAGTPGHVPHRR